MTNPDTTFSEAAADLPLMALRAVIHTVYWAGSLGLFGGFTLLALQLPALAAKVRSRSVRFFDLALPATIVFFFTFRTSAATNMVPATGSSPGHWQR